MVVPLGTLGVRALLGMVHHRTITVKAVRVIMLALLLTLGC